MISQPAHPAAYSLHVLASSHHFCLTVVEGPSKEIHCAHEEDHHRHRGCLSNQLLLGRRPAQATTDSAPTQNAVNTQPKAHVKGIIDGLCTLYPDWCFN